MSFVANKIIQYLDAKGNPVDVTLSDPMPVGLNSAGTEVLLQQILVELKILNTYNAMAHGDILTEEDVE